MRNVKTLIKEAGVTMTDQQIENLTYIIEDMEADFNENNGEEEFGLHDIYESEDDEVVIVCMEEMVQHSTELEQETLDKLNTACTDEELNKIANRVKIEIT
ncbi:hypothetical protein BUZ69_04500 [Staphylococcus saprophyticus]|uniref:hypothetical protein n=1 Tax=Staphylococcus saprophyticus TaxID=29385 RepID=UPI000D1E56D1|nr:hypothetical protein [Staphylococcus saprophyticus]PTK47101.1 hypothetical protein BUZ69_04500 [Staphylococcus saprophyticus]